MALRQAAGNDSAQDRIRTETGVQGDSILGILETTNIPYSFPVDLMHMMINIIKQMFEIWIGNFQEKPPKVNKAQTSVLKNTESSNILQKKVVQEYTKTPTILPLYHISNPKLQIIGAKMVSSKRGIPGSMGHAPRNIALHWRGFKAEEWKLWAVLYSTPLLKDAGFPLLYL